VSRHIFQACPVWIYTQSNITNISYSPEYITPTQKKSLLQLVGKLASSLLRTQSCWQVVRFLRVYVWLNDVQCICVSCDRYVSVQKRKWFTLWWSQKITCIPKEKYRWLNHLCIW
jgi:hypothetical protein